MTYRNSPERQKFKLVEITPERLEGRFAEVLSKARDHKNDLVLTYNVGQYWPIRMGVVRDDIASEEVNVQNVIDLTDPLYIATDGKTVKEFASPIQFNIDDAFKTLLTFRSRAGGEIEEPQFYIVFGSRAITAWLQLSQQEGLPGAKAEQLTQMMEYLGFPPILTESRWSGDVTKVTLET